MLPRALFRLPFCALRAAADRKQAGLRALYCMALYFAHALRARLFVLPRYLLYATTRAARRDYITHEHYLRQSRHEYALCYLTDCRAAAELPHLTLFIMPPGLSGMPAR